MSSVLDLSGLTLNPKEVTEVSEAIFETVYGKPELNAAHNVMTGIAMKQQIAIFGLMGDVGVADTGCSAPASSANVAASQKYWEPKMIGFRLSHCQADVSQLFKMWKKSMIAKNQLEDVDGAMLTFLTQRVIDATHESILRLSSFGDTAATKVADGGTVSDAKTLAMITPIDGLWKQIVTAVTAGTVEKVAISENALATYAAQNALADGKAYDTLKAMYNAADPRLLAEPDKVFQVTRSLYTNLLEFYETKTLAAGFVERTEDGKNGLKFRGVELIIRDDWDRNIRAWFDNGTKWVNPHRAILTTKGNIPLGTSDEESMKSVEAFYDKKDRVHYFDVDYMLDVKLLEEYKIVAAY